MRSGRVKDMHSYRNTIYSLYEHGTPHVLLFGLSISRRIPAQCTTTSGAVLWCDGSIIRGIKTPFSAFGMLMLRHYRIIVLQKWQTGPWFVFQRIL